MSHDPQNPMYQITMQCTVTTTVEKCQLDRIFLRPAINPSVVYYELWVEKPRLERLLNDNALFGHDKRTNISSIQVFVVGTVEKPSGESSGESSGDLSGGA